jgi:hypothetical protein
MIDGPHRILYPQSIERRAAQYARVRVRLNAGRRKADRRFERGDQNEHVDRIGVIAEMVARQSVPAWFPNAKSVEFAPLVAVDPVPGADITVDGVRYDVKGVAPKLDALMLPDYVHDNAAKRIDRYWFVQLLRAPGIADFYFVDFATVSTWPKRKTKIAGCLSYVFEKRKDGRKWQNYESNRSR